jgi:pilus assembly protein CpaB
MARIRKLSSGSGLLLLATAVGLITAAVAFVWISGDETEEPPPVTITEPEPVQTVVVARRDIAAGEELQSSSLEVVEVPAADAVDGGFAAADELLGRATRYPIFRREQVVEARLVSPDTEESEGLAFSVPPRMRAFSVPVSEQSGAGGLIIPGDRVDVMVATAFGRLFGPTDLSTEESHPIVITVLQDVLVLAVGQEITASVDDGRDSATLRLEEAEPQPSARSVTLAVTPSQAQLLFLAAEQGRLGLALRPFGDGLISPLEPTVKLEALIETGRGQTAAR